MRWLIAVVTLLGCDIPSEIARPRVPISPPTSTSECAKNGEAACFADPRCEPVHAQKCETFSPDYYVEETRCAIGFTACIDGTRVDGVDAGKSILVRDAGVLDAPAFSFARVMARLSGRHHPGDFVEAWLGQLGEPITVGARTAQPRPLAARWFSLSPRDGDVRLDLERLGFTPTALSNRIDLARPDDCGEARITYALTGVSDTVFERMTVIIELRQPDDGLGCVATARRWIALSRLEGAALTDALAAIYEPLLEPASLNQVRTNEFIVGISGAPWEMREWRLDADGQLRLAPCRQSLAADVGVAPAFLSWLQANLAGVVDGSAVIPDEFLSVASRADATRLFVPSTLYLADKPLNQMSCAGCHTTETDTSFVHVGERDLYARRRALISAHLRDELLPKRTQALAALGREAGALLRLAAHATH